LAFRDYPDYLPPENWSNCSFQHHLPIDLCCQAEVRRKRHIQQEDKSKPRAKFEWTFEAITSVAILQLPAFSLALLGLLRAKSCSDVLKTVPIVCTPFFLLGFLDFFLSFLFQQCTKKGLEKAGLLWFLGSTEEQRALGLDTSRAFSGNALQLLFQLVLLLGFTPWKSHRGSQLVSIASSLFQLINVSAQLITFKKETETEPIEEQERGVKEKVKDFVLEKLQRLQSFLALFPLLLSSAVFNVGTMALAISVLGRHSLWFIFGSLLLHLLLFFCLPLPADLDNKVVKTFNLEKHLPGEERNQNSKPLLSSLFFCSSNLFIFSCSTDKAKKNLVTFLLLVQFLRFLTNTCLLMLLLLFYGFNANFQRVGTCICVFGRIRSD